MARRWEREGGEMDKIDSLLQKLREHDSRVEGGIRRVEGRRESWRQAVTEVIEPALNEAVALLENMKVWRGVYVSIPIRPKGSGTVQFSFGSTSTGIADGAGALQVERGGVLVFSQGPEGHVFTI